MPKLRSNRCQFEQLERRELMAGLESGEPVVYEPGLLDSRNWGPGLVSLDKVPRFADPTLNYGMGNITAEVVDGVLKIRGDAGRNIFSIFAVSGEGVSFFTNSLLNGESTFAIGFDVRKLRFNNVTAIDIDLGDNDDGLEVTETLLPKLTVRMGDGNDRIALKGIVPSILGMTMSWPVGGVLWSTPQVLKIQGDLDVDMGPGDDEFSAWADVAGDATILMGDGDDSYLEKLYPLQSGVSFDSVTSQPIAQPQFAGKLTASGTVRVDLGAGQDVDNIPTKWWENKRLSAALQDVPRLLTYYQEVVARGELTPGVPQVIMPPWSDAPVRFDAEGRLEVEIFFEPGYGHVIERLQARGVILDAYSVISGRARAAISEDDLVLFGNLPGWEQLFPRYSTHNVVYTGHSLPAVWDNVRPGSFTAAEVGAVVTGPELVLPFGPLRPSEVQPKNSLRDSYYGDLNFDPLELAPPQPSYILL